VDSDDNAGIRISCRRQRLFYDDNYVDEIAQISTNYLRLNSLTIRRSAQ